ncbi:MAG: alpha/beta fold hydrolase [Acidimicrobiales bacterium]|nr:alpha/beta fold hydrolase [Acidimicrobiales bacterium]
MMALEEGTTDVRVAGVRLRVRVMGDGPPLLLLMGLGGNLDMWQPLSAALKGRRLIMFDMPGSGGSSGPRLPPTMAHNAWLVNRVLRRLGLDEVDVLGYSWGGMLAQQVALQHPARVRKLVLASTHAGLGSIPGRPSVMRIMATPRRYYSRSYLRAVAPKIYGGKARTATDVATQADQRLTRPPSRLGYMTQLIAAGTFSSLAWLPLVVVPTLVLCGDDDPLVPTVNAHILAHRLPNAQLSIVANAGHLLLMDSVDEVVPIIEQFLAGGTRQ